MFWAKTRMGWKETNVQEHTGANGTEIQNQKITIEVVDARKNAKIE